MASTYSDLKIELIGTGDQSGTWGATTNTNLGTALEEAIVGRATANFTSDANLTITLSNANTTQVARNYILNVTSAVALTVTRSLIVPTIDKPYIIENNTTGGQSILVKTSAGTGITVPTGKTVMVYANGTNVVQAFDYVPSVTVGTVNITSLTAGSITDSGLTAGRVTYAGTAGLLADSASLTYDGTTLTSTKFAGALNGSLGATTPSTVVATTGSFTGPTPTGSALAVRTTGGDAVSITTRATGLGGVISATDTTLATYANLDIICNGAFIKANNGATVLTINSTGLAVTGNLSATGTLTGITDLTTTGNTILGNASTDTLNVGNGGLVKDASGNVGVGVTPSTWSTSYKALQIAYGSLWAQTATPTFVSLSANSYYSAGGYTYSTTGIATDYYQNNGTHVWRTAPSGTAGTAITFTTAMTLDASGRLLVGTSTSNAAFAGNLQVEGTTNAFASLVRYSSSVSGAPGLYLARSKSATLGTNTIVASGDVLGTVLFSGANGTGYSDAAYIQGAVDGTPGASADMPGRLVFATSADGSATPTERMRIDSAGNVGIGTASPATKLQVVGEIRSSTDISNSGDPVIYSYNGGTAGTVRSGIQLIGSTQEIRLLTASTTRATIDSSGNVGIGVTPSAWGANYKAVQVGAGGGIWAGAAGELCSVVSNTYFNGTQYKYIISSSWATRYDQTGGTHNWSVAPIGTAGATATFTTVMTLGASGSLTLQDGQFYQWGDGTTGISGSGASDYLKFYTTGLERMQIDSSGNVGIGVTPSAWSVTYKAVQVGNTSLSTSGATGTTAYITGNGYYNGTNWIYQVNDYASRYACLYGNGTHAWFTAPSGTAGNAITFTQAMTIDNSGNVGIGISTPSSKLDLYDGIYYLRLNPATEATITTNGATGLTLNSSAASTNINFRVAGAERMRIDSSGNVGIGVTPSAWYSTAKAIEIGALGNSVYGNGGASIHLTSNAYYSAVNAWKYGITGSAAGRYELTDGISKWFTAASGTAGNAITFTQAMTLNASGNLLVGQTAVGNGGTVAVNGTISICGSATGSQIAMAKDGTQQTASISTTATTIFTSIIQGLSSAAAGICYVYGSNNAGANFFDVVVVFPSGTPSVLHSTTLSGAPAARTYTMSTNALRLVMASGTYSVNVKVTTMGFPF